MHNMARVPIPSEDIFSTTVSGQPKSDILVQLQARLRGWRRRVINLSLVQPSKPATSCTLTTGDEVQRLRSTGLIAGAPPRRGLPLCGGQAQHTRQGAHLRMRPPAGVPLRA